MKIFLSMFEKSYKSDSNPTLIILAALSIIFLTAFLAAMLLINFKEVYNTKGVLVPREERILSLQYDSYIKDSSVKIGRSFRKGEIILKLDKDEVRLTITDLTNQLHYKKEKIKISSDVMSTIELRDIRNQIGELETQLKNLSESLLETDITAPFDCIIVSSDFEGVQHGFIRKGIPLAKVITLEKPLFKSEIYDDVIGKIKKGQVAIIKINKRRLKIYGNVEKIEIGEKNGKYMQNAYVTINQTDVADIGMDVEMQIVLDEMSIKEFLLQAFGIYKKIKQ